MVFIKKQYFGKTSKAVKDLLGVWEEEWRGIKGEYERRREVACLAAALVLVFDGGLRGENFLLAYL